MKAVRQIMGMPVTIIWSDESVSTESIENIFDFFRAVDVRYSPFITTSMVSKINRGELPQEKYDKELRHILRLAQQTTDQTGGYFNVWHDGVFDPSGIVKGWAIHEAAKLLADLTANYYVEVGGDIEVSGHAPTGQPWHIGIRNPFDRTENIAIIQLDHGSIATSGTAIRGNHIYNPLVAADTLEDIVSLSVTASNIVDADRMATAAFAMGTKGIQFIESLPGYEGYMVDRDKRVTMTTHWHTYEVPSS